MKLRLFAFDDERIDPFHDGLLRIHRHAAMSIAVQVPGKQEDAGQSEADVVVECTYAAPGWVQMPEQGQTPTRHGRPEVLSRVLDYAKECLARGGYDIILLDNTLRSPTGDQRDYGVDELLPVAREGSPDALIAIITGYRMIADERSEALHRAFGNEVRADMWLPKTSESLCDTLCSIILLVARGKADRERRLALEPLDQKNREELADGVVPEGTIFTSPAMANVVALAVRGARSPSTPVFILGPTGAGKKHLIDIIRANDPRGEDTPWELVNCGAIPKDSNAQIAYLFGYEKGDYTGSVQAGPGAVRRADGGNLVLDEVHTLSHEAQQALLHVIDQGDARDLAGRAYRVSLRVVAASNMERQRLKGPLLTDFLRRLWCWPIEIPSLNSRRDDIAPLASEFVREASAEAGRPITITPEALEFLRNQDWSEAEVSQLRNTIRNAAIRSGAEIQVAHVRKAYESLSLSETASVEGTFVVPATDLDGWMGKLDLQELHRLCVDIWESRGENIENNPDNLVGMLACSPYYLRAVLAAFWHALRKERDTFNELFGLLRPPREKMELRQYLQKAARDYPTVFPAGKGRKNFGVSDLIADGEDLRGAGFRLQLT